VKRQPRAPADEARAASRWGRLASLLSAYPLGMVALSAIYAVAPVRAGPLAVTEILAPHLFLASLGLVPLAALRGTRVLRAALLLELAVFVVRFGPGAVSPPVAATPGARREVVATWNVLSDGRDPARTIGALRSLDAGIVAIQELSDSISAGIEADPAITARYPHRISVPRHDVFGIGLLSAYPIVDAGQLADPPLIWATLDLGLGRRLTVVTAHPVPGRIGALGPLPIPVDFDPTLRDRAVARVRATLDPLLARGEPVLVMGDFNLTDREPAYRELTAGLVDGQRAAGSWPASTWRPMFARGWSLGLLRIDYLLTGPGVRPLEVAPDCTPSGSDHCLVRGVIELG
jgi:vancomycin resistance protein VanJ